MPVTGRSMLLANWQALTTIQILQRWLLLFCAKRLPNISIHIEIFAFMRSFAKKIPWFSSCACFVRFIASLDEVHESEYVLHLSIGIQASGWAREVFYYWGTCRVYSARGEPTCRQQPWILHLPIADDDSVRLYRLIHRGTKWFCVHAWVDYHLDASRQCVISCVLILALEICPWSLIVSASSYAPPLQVFSSMSPIHLCA